MVVVRELGNNVILLHFIAVGGHCHRKVRIKNQEVAIPVLMTEIEKNLDAAYITRIKIIRF